MNHSDNRRAGTSGEPEAFRGQAEETSNLGEMNLSAENESAEAAQGASPLPNGRTRKERVLHTRIPEVLESELKQLATSLRVPVSNLVRTILQDAIEAAEMVGRAAEHELRGAADRLARSRGRMQGAAAERGAQLGRTAARKPVPMEADDASLGTLGEKVPDVTKEAASEAAAESRTGADPALRAALFEGVLGYQSIVLALETRCSRCQKTLAMGESAYLGVRDTTGPRVIIGPECLPSAPR